ncbi:MAG: hypothetical protein ACC650_08485 [Gammaproteobacteria bacterium]
MEIECRKNIRELHVFIESWLKGAVEKSRQEFQYFEDELDEEFVIIHPGGELQTKSEIISDFWNAYGVQSENFIIEIRNIKIRFESKDICIMNYEEWQTSVEKTARISTVIFRKSLNSNKNNWLHLHETWYPGK